MPTDRKQTTNDKDLVLAAISALKAKGAEVSAQTVAEEAHIPRSRLYRDTELMELINEESTATSSETSMTDEDPNNKVRELEDKILALEEIIWNLEESAETAVKKQQDAYHAGFQKGVEEATRRLTTGARQTETESAKVDDDQFTMAGATALDQVDRKLLRDTGPLPANMPALSNVDTGPLPQLNPATSLHDSEFIYYEPPTAPIRPVSLPFELDFSSPDLSEFTSSDTADSGSANDTTSPAPDKAAEHKDYSVIATGDFEPFSTNYSFKPPDEIEPVAADSLAGETLAGDSLYASEYSFGNGLLTSEAEFDFSTMSKGQGDGDLQSSLQQETAQARSDRAPRDPDSIYNIARSGPTVSSEFNPLVELSWKDLQNVYNFSVASLKDYARTGVLESKPAQPVKPRLQATAGQEQITAPPPPASAYDYDGPSTDDPNRTGDRLQALADPRNLFDTDAVVDLDALDIFDDLDDYVDLDKIEIINDVQTQPAKSQEIGMGGEELRELIKGRIRQAADLPPEAAAPRMTAPPAGGKTDGEAVTAPGGGGLGGALKGGGARNKFVGGAKSGEPPPAPAAPMVRQIPPEIRRSCMILGIKPEELNQRLVIDAWKRQIASPGVHPDHGGDTETAVFLNTAKDTLVRWLDAQAPKLGKKFGKPHEGGKPPEGGGGLSGGIGKQAPPPAGGQGSDADKDKDK